MHLLCSVGESVCATSHLIYFYPAVKLRGAQHPLYATKKKPEMHVLAKRCKEMNGPWFFSIAGETIKVALNGPFGAYGNLNTSQWVLCNELE